MKRKIIAVALLASLAYNAQADGIPVEPGMWSITTTVNIPMMPAPQTETIEECMEDEVIDMNDMAGEDMDPGCSYELGQVDGNTMNWSIDCPLEGGTMHAEWTATSGGDTVSGEGKMTINMQGQTMNMTMSWDGKRTGDCN
jgi:hypothetical protein